MVNSSSETILALKSIAKIQSALKTLPVFLTLFSIHKGAKMKSVMTLEESKKQVLFGLNKLLESLNNSSSLSLSITERKKQTKILLEITSEQGTTPSAIASAAIGFGKIPSAYISDKGHLSLINKNIDICRKDINKMLSIMMKERIKNA